MRIINCNTKRKSIVLVVQEPNICTGSKKFALQENQTKPEEINCGIGNFVSISVPCDFFNLVLNGYDIPVI